MEDLRIVRNVVARFRAATVTVDLRIVHNVVARFRSASVTVKKIPAYGGSSRWVVVRGTDEIGLVEKARSTRTQLNPYKAFAGIGHDAKFIGSFYDAAETKKWGYQGDDPDMTYGGMDAALKAVERSAS